MRSPDGRVYKPFRTRLVLGKRAAEGGWKKGAIQFRDVDPTPEDDPTFWYMDAETARALASDLVAAAQRLERLQNAREVQP